MRSTCAVGWPYALVAAAVVGNELVVAAHSDARPAWSWLALATIPVVAGRLPRNVSTPLVGGAYVLGLLIVDLALSLLGWNHGKPAGWDLLDSDPAFVALLECALVFAWAAALAALAQRARRCSVPASRGHIAATTLSLTLLVPTGGAPILARLALTARVPAAATTTVAHPDLIVVGDGATWALNHANGVADTRAPTDAVNVRYVDPGVAGVVTIAVEARGAWHAATVQLGTSDHRPRARSITIRLGFAPTPSEIERLRLRVWPQRRIELYVTAIIIGAGPIVSSSERRVDQIAARSFGSRESLALRGVVAS